MSADLLSLTAVSAASQIRGGKLRLEALMEAYLDSVAHREPVVRAFVHFDAAQARKLAASDCSGPLRGISIGVKDFLDTADMPSQYGSPIWTCWRPRDDAAAVAWARAAGGVPIGKTSQPIYLKTPNRICTGLLPGHLQSSRGCHGQRTVGTLRRADSGPPTRGVAPVKKTSARSRDHAGLQPPVSGTPFRVGRRIRGVASPWTGCQTAHGR